MPTFTTTLGRIWVPFYRIALVQEDLETHLTRIALHGGSVYSTDLPLQQVVQAIDAERTQVLAQIGRQPPIQIGKF